MLKITKKSIVYYFGFTAVFIFYAIFFNTARAQTFQLLDKSIFKDSEKSSIIIRPHFVDYTTSLVLYVSNGDTPETWTYEPETIGSGYFLFTDYFSFGSPVGRYILIEYKNDKQTFSCYGLPLSACLADPRYVSQFKFEITGNNTVVNPNTPPSPPAAAGGGTPPVLAILNTPSPRVVASDTGLISYAYTVWNVGAGHNQTMADIVVTDDNCSPITFLAGDLNSDGKLNEGENWEYSCVARLSQTTTNTATVIGYSDDDSRQSATASTTTTVVVVPEQNLQGITPVPDTEFPSSALSSPNAVPSSDTAPTVPPSDTLLLPDTGFIPAGEFYSNTGLLRPFIHIVKVSDRLTNTYIITNPGDVPINNISVVDNVCAPISYASGDVNGNTLLGPNETWTYTCTTVGPVKTRSIARVVGRANTFTPVDIFITDPANANLGFVKLVGIIAEIILILALIAAIIGKQKNRLAQVWDRVKRWITKRLGR